MRRPHYALVSCWLYALATLAPHAARAGDPLESAAEAKALEDKAGALYLEGVALYKDSKWQEARVAFLAAWNLKNHWQIAGNLADCELQLGRHREAAEYMTYYLRNAPPERRERAEAFLKKATAKIATLTVKVEPAGVEVLIDGIAVGRAPLAEPLFVEPGRRKLSARSPGMPDAVEILDLTAGSARSVSLTLSATTAVPHVEPEPDTAVRTGLLIGGTALTAILVAGGVVFTVVSNGKASDADMKLAELQTGAGLMPCSPGAAASDCTAVKELNQGSDTFGDLALAGYVAAGLAAAATLTYGLWPRTKTPHVTGMSAAPWIGGSTGGVVLTGRF